MKVRQVCSAASRCSFSLAFALPRCAAHMIPRGLQPFPPFRIAGNLYYVGSAGPRLVPHRHAAAVSSSSTASLEVSAPLIRKSVESLGFHFSDIKILLISHAHYDHCAGSARDHQTHRREILSNGRAMFRWSSPAAKPTFNTARERHAYPPAHVDRVLHDGDTVEPRRHGAHRALDRRATPRAPPPGPWTRPKTDACCTSSSWAAPM